MRQIIIYKARNFIILKWNYSLPSFSLQLGLLVLVSFLDRKHCSQLECNWADGILFGIQLYLLNCVLRVPMMHCSIYENLFTFWYKYRGVQKNVLASIEPSIAQRTNYQPLLLLSSARSAHAARHSRDSCDLRHLLRKHYTTLPRNNCNYMSFGSKDIDYVSKFFFYPSVLYPVDSTLQVLQGQHGSCSTFGGYKRLYIVT
jgi:hypothetical protein